MVVDEWAGELTRGLQILRLLNTNVDGKQKVMYALTKIKGVGRRYSNLVCKKADVDLNKRYVTQLPKGATQAAKDWRILSRALSPVLVSSRPKSSSESSPSSRTRLSTRFPSGSSTDSATLWTARIRRCSPTASTRSCARIWSASRRFVPTVVSATTGACVSAASTPRRLVAGAGLSVCPRRRVVRQRDDYGAGWTGVTAGFSISPSIFARTTLSCKRGRGFSPGHGHEAEKSMRRSDATLGNDVRVGTPGSAQSCGAMGACSQGEAPDEGYRIVFSLDA